MKRKLILLVFVAVFGFSGVANAALLEVIGHVTYYGTWENLIYEKDKGLVWLDYTHGLDTWDNSKSWATGLNTSGLTDYTYTALKPGETWVWDGVWRLPSAGTNPQVGYYQTTSEMGHLDYVSLGNTGYLNNKVPFTDLKARNYWSGTEYSATHAWYTELDWDRQNHYSKSNNYYALAVREGHVVSAPVPIPPSVWLLGSGLLGLIGLRRKFRK